VLFCDVTQHKQQFLPDVSGQPIGPTFRGQGLKMGIIGCPKTSARNYDSTQHIPEECRSHPHHDRRLKSCRVLKVFGIHTHTLTHAHAHTHTLTRTHTHSHTSIIIYKHQPIFFFCKSINETRIS
jgi:hypothetical protein